MATTDPHLATVVGDASLRAALDVLASRVAVLDDAGAIVTVNRAWRAAADTAGHELEGLTVGSSYLATCEAARGPGAEDARAVSVAIRDVLAGSNAEHIVASTQTTPGERRWFSVRITGAIINGQRGAVIVHDDVTDRWKAEQARRLVTRGELEAQVDVRTRELREANQRLREAETTLRASEARFRAAAASTADLIVELDVVKGRLEWFGDVDGLLGYPPGGFPRTGEAAFLALVHPDDVDRIEQMGRGHLDDGATFRAEYRIQAADGRYHDWDVVAKVTERVDGKPTRSIGTVRDVTERKALERAHRAAEAALEHSQTELRALTERLFAVQEAERSRLARELHDSFNQQTAAMSIQLGKLRQRYPELPVDLRQQLADVQDQIVELSNDLRRVSRELHPAALEQLGLEAALKTYCARVNQQDDFDVVFAAEAVPRQVPAGVALCIFRLAQEALRNATRHSRSKQAHATLRGVDGGVELRVVDDGCGFDVSTVRREGSLGLVSMEERVRPLHGRLTITSDPGAGTSVTAYVPIGADE